jgi:hypothetical protein
MKQRKYLPLFIGGLSAVTLAQASAGIINTDAGLAGQKFCWSQGWDQETYGRDRTYSYYYRPSSGQWDKQLSDKGTWTISKDGTVTLKLVSGGTQTRRYDINGNQVKELTKSLFNWTDAPGKRC